MEPETELSTIIMNRKIPNALLFTGLCGEEKKRAGMKFAKTINCLCREFGSNSLNSEPQSEFIESLANRKSIQSGRFERCSIERDEQFAEYPDETKRCLQSG